MPLLFVLKKKMAPKVNINVEKLISLIKINPVIYDKKDRDHKDINVLRNVWESIANAMQITDCKYFFFSSEKHERVAACAVSTSLVKSSVTYLNNSEKLKEITIKTQNTHYKSTQDQNR